MANRTGLVVLAAVLTMATTVMVGRSGPVEAVAVQPYQILIRPADAQNPLNTNHRFIVEVRTDSDADERIDEPVIGVDVELVWGGPAGSAIFAVNGTTVPPSPPGTATCTTIASASEPNGGICAVDVGTPLDVGVGTLTASFLIPGASPGVPQLPTLPADQGTTCAAGYVPGPTIEACDQWVDVQSVQVRGGHTWVGYAVDVDSDAVLPVRTSHTFDVLADRHDGVSRAPAADIIANFSWMNGPSGSAVTDVNGAPMPGATSCITSTAGDCTVTVTSPRPGPGMLRLDSLVGALIGTQPKTESPTPSSDRLAEATWVDWRVIITPPDATNLVGDDHVFTLTLETDDGTGWTSDGAGSSISTAWAGSAGSSITAVSAGSVTGGSAATCQTDTDGQCTVTVNSATIGSGVLTASTVVVSLPGYVPPGGVPGDSFIFDVVDAEGGKTWIEFFAALSPSATNLAGDPHTFTVTATYDDGAGIKDVPDGSTVAFTWVGDGAATSASPCTITSATCDVVVSSAVGGSGMISATTVSALINGDPFVDTVIAAASGGSTTATKSWIQLFASVGETATNLVTDPHTFTIAASYDDGSSVQPVPDGSTVHYAWTGTGTATPPTSCTTVGGSCDVVVTSVDTGSGTIEVLNVTTTIDGAAFDSASPVATAGMSLSAEKTWVDFRISVTPPNDQNLVETDHIFTVLIERDAGDGYLPYAEAVPTIDLDGVGVIAAETCSDGTTAAGTCTIVGISEEPGDMAVTATFAAREAGSATLTIGDTADKLWVNYRITLTPKQAINQVDEQHVFVAKLEVDHGDGFQVAKNESLAIGATGVGAIIGIDAAGQAANTCVTDAVGTCRITVNSAEPGTLFLSAKYDAIVGDTTGTFTAAATKGWIQNDLPQTGNESGGLIRIAVGLAAAGLALLLMAQRRRALTLA